MDIVDKEQLAHAAGYSRSWFWKMVHQCSILMDQLHAVGYRKTQKQLSEKQVELIKRHYCID